ncbi:MAG TPA: glutamine amidotransferase [Opitutales bacterium]|nr:glutamine amidotransferase [Opitutales bacterium]
MPRELASIVFAAGSWRWIALAGAVVLVPLAMVALRPRLSRPGTTAVALALRTLGIGLLLGCLLDPQWTFPRAKPGANYFAVVADNSASLNITDAGARQARGEQVKDTLTGANSGWLASLSAVYQLRPYVFDTSLRRVRDFNELDFSGERSSLGASLRDLRGRFAGQPLAGVLLFTDGDATDFAGGLPDLSGLPPIYPVLVGTADGLRDVRLSSVTVRQTVFDDAPVSVEADVAAQGMSSQDVAVQVKPLNAPALKKGESDTTPAAQTTHLYDAQPAEVNFDWHPRGSGPQFFDVSVGAANGQSMNEATTANNHRVVMVDRGRPAYRILYVAGRPNWEFKFLNRALEDDPQLQMVGLFRIAPREPKFQFIGRGDNGNPLFTGFDSTDDTHSYDQPVLRVVNAKDENELKSGFPTSPATLFAYDAVILDDVEAAFLTTDQLALLRRYVAERGGGLLLFGGADTFEAGGYLNTPLAPALPVYLDRKAAAIPQGEMAWNLTREGWLEPWTRVRAVETDERERLMKLPKLDVANALNGVKPGATVLATVTDESGHVYPGLVVQNYGAGRVAALPVGDLWETGVLRDESTRLDLYRFERQLARWLVTNVPPPVEIKVRPATDGHSVTLRVTAHDENYQPLDLGKAAVKITRVAVSSGAKGTDFAEMTLPALPVADAPGVYEATFTPRDAGAYLADAKVTDRTGKDIGHAQTGWVNDPAIEEFQSLAPNRAQMEELARRTGGQVISSNQLGDLAKMLPNRYAPITEEDATPLWHQSSVFLAVLLCFLAEWGWRRWKGLP